jgi:DNA mismatch endonuclease, patch repair protein
MDRLTPQRRSWLMSRIRGKDTAPEMAVRSLAHTMGYRFRVHYQGLPGTPDLAFPGRTKAIFVHGCFWHGHKCKKTKMPKSRTDYWGPKILANRARDTRKLRAIRRRGWNALVVWECETKNIAKLSGKLRRFLGQPSVRLRRAPKTSAEISPVLSTSRLSGAAPAEQSRRKVRRSIYTLATFRRR